MSGLCTVFSILHLAQLLVVWSSLSGLGLVLHLGPLPVALHTAAATDEAADAEHDFDSRHNEERNVLSLEVCLRGVILVGQEWVVAVLHNANHDEEVDANERCEGTVETTAG